MSKTIECACGCGQKLEEKDKYGRKRKFISGHNGRKYDPKDKLAYQKEWVKKNRDWMNSYRKERSRKRKIELMELFGSHCGSCDLEYDGKNGAVFDFHHLDESTKSFAISSALNDKSMAKLKEECKKCVLLCANCHRIHHLGEW